MFNFFLFQEDGISQVETFLQFLLKIPENAKSEKIDKSEKSEKDKKNEKICQK